jgi:hypothetical protein
VPKPRYRTLFSLFGLLLAACGQEAQPVRDTGPSDFQKQLQTQLITAQPGDVITIPAGVRCTLRASKLLAIG